jgi:hypothetical protein
MTARRAAVLLVAACASIAFAQTPAAPPQETPAECLKSVRDQALKRQRELTPLTAEGVRAIAADRLAMAKACAAKFDVAAVSEKDLSGLIDLLTEAGLPQQADAAVTRALASTSLSDADRATVLAQAVRAGLREPKSPERNARLEALVAELDRMPDSVLVKKLDAHQAMNGYYRGDDIDDGIIRHSTWIIEAAKRFTPEQRRQYGFGIVSAYINMAEAWAGHGRTADALALLAQGKTDWAELPSIDERIDPTIERYRLVGTPAAAIGAERWLNGSAGTSTLEMTGAVTLLEFTAHWCGPCRESYPGVKRLLALYGARGFRVVLATELYGYFEREGNLAPDVEFERDREYFRKEGLDVPIAVANRPAPQTVNGRPVYVRSANDEAYKVGGIPQIHLIDRKGIIRLIMVGYDDANEPRLARLIEDLLNEK